jgi:pimeloyl-ACP methyl ester carboxylesterase
MAGVSIAVAPRHSSWIARKDYPADVSRFQKSRHATRRAAAVSRDRAGCGSEDLDQRLAAMRRPAPVIWGARDPYLPVRYAHRQQDTVANADVIVLPDSGHWPTIDNPVAVEAP